VVALLEFFDFKRPKAHPGDDGGGGYGRERRRGNVSFTSGEIAELNAAVRAIEIKGQRLPNASSRSRPWKRRRRNSG